LNRLRRPSPQCAAAKPSSTARMRSRCAPRRATPSAAVTPSLRTPAGSPGCSSCGTSPTAGPPSLPGDAPSPPRLPQGGFTTTSPASPRRRAGRDVRTLAQHPQPTPRSRDHVNPPPAHHSDARQRPHLRRDRIPTRHHVHQTSNTTSRARAAASESSATTTDQHTPAVPVAPTTRTGPAAATVFRAAEPQAASAWSERGAAATHRCLSSGQASRAIAGNVGHSDEFRRCRASGRARRGDRYHREEGQQRCSERPCHSGATLVLASRAGQPRLPVAGPRADEPLPFTRPHGAG
jgi:hypothetical protein